jgi:hypothetical protein
MGGGDIGMRAVSTVPGLYSDLSHVIAVVTISMALMALVRLRPAIKRRASQRGRAVPGGNADARGPVG